MTAGRPPIVCRGCGETAPPGGHPDMEYCPIYDEEAAADAGWSRTSKMEWECCACAPNAGRIAMRNGALEAGDFMVPVCIGDREVDAFARLNRDRLAMDRPAVDSATVLGEPFTRRRS
jgi:hypothetical protein